MIKVTDIDLVFAKNYLRVDHTDDDQLIELIIVASKSFIQSYLNKKFTEFDELPEELTIPCLALASHWYERREIQTNKSANEVLYTFAGILDMHRVFVGGELL
ncbi:DNA-packaging protein [Bacillus cereus]|uniref:head-tail connector protein n=1 Tax=Bacillus cereus group TaxID=86661 RepID=UPI000BFBC2B9|nr:MULTISPECIES: head-tail connector protein [Bacillus cereus group]PGN97332.1 DNA-packaging protein [Bacillus cereus]